MEKYGNKVLLPLTKPTAAAAALRPSWAPILEGTAPPENLKKYENSDKFWKLQL